MARPAGVAFSCDPASGRRDLIVIEAAEGLGEAVAGRRDEGVEGRQRRRRRAFRAEPGEHDAGALDHGIAALAHALAELRAERLGRRFEAAPVDRELPAVEGAAQAIGLVAAEREIGAAVRALAIEQAEAAGAVAKENEVLAEQADRLDRPRRQRRIDARIEFLDQRRRLPVAAHQRAARRAGADARDPFVFFGL